MYAWTGGLLKLLSQLKAELTRLGLQSHTPVSYLPLSKSFAQFRKIFFVKKYYGWKKSKVEKIIVKKDFGQKKSLWKKIFGRKKSFVDKYFGQNIFFLKILGPKKLGQRNFQSKKFLVEESFDKKIWSK